MGFWTSFMTYVSTPLPWWWDCGFGLFCMMMGAVDSSLFFGYLGLAHICSGANRFASKGGWDVHS